MTTIGMHYDVIPGKEQEFERGFYTVLEHLKKMPGHIESHLYDEVAARGTYLILSQWESKESFEAFIHSPEFKSTTNWGKAEILKSRPRHKVYLNQ